MTIDEFETAITAFAAVFVEEWKESSRIRPDAYPNELPSFGEWLEHMFLWRDDES